MYRQNIVGMAVGSSRCGGDLSRKLNALSSKSRWPRSLGTFAGVLLCSVALSMAYATLRTKRLAREDHLLHREVAE